MSGNQSTNQIINSNNEHTPVMLSDVLNTIFAGKSEPSLESITIFDGTFGRGGYSEAFLRNGARVIATDQDKTTENFAIPLIEEYKQNFSYNITKASNYLQQHVEDNTLDAIVIDIGVSSMQLDQDHRGFSFMKSGELDMRMAQTDETVPTAFDLITKLDEFELAQILYHYGEENKSRQIAKKIIEATKNNTAKNDTSWLSNYISSIVHYNSKSKKHPATKSFQALRIAVNNELLELIKILFLSSLKLKPEGKMIVVSFHSLEDRIAKLFFKAFSPDNVKTNKYKSKFDNYANSSITNNLTETQQNNFTVFNEYFKSITPNLEEINANPRARSAKLRYGVKSHNISANSYNDLTLSIINYLSYQDDTNAGDLFVKIKQQIHDNLSNKRYEAISKLLSLIETYQNIDLSVKKIRN